VYAKNILITEPSVTELSLEIIFVLSLIAMFAGFIDAIGGGGGLITIPALMLAGLSPVEALGTNKLQAMFGKLSSVRYFHKHKVIDFKQLTLPLVICFGFASLGAYGVQRIDAEILAQIVPWLIMAVAVYIVFSPKINDNDKSNRISLSLFSFSMVPLIAFYDGFFGPSSGSFFAISFIVLLGFGVSKATAYTKLFLLFANFAALVFFAIGGKVLWFVGIAMAFGQWIGARYGSQLVHIKGSKIVKPMLLVISGLMVVKLLYSAG
jgi:uncharacterized membrane protein YfcA